MTKYITEVQADRLLGRVLHVAKELRSFCRDYGDDVYGRVSDRSAYLVEDLESRLGEWIDLAGDVANGGKPVQVAHSAHAAKWRKRREAKGAGDEQAE